MENLALPSQKTESGPEAWRTAISLSPISVTAWSQDIRCHWPLTSFIGYLMRRSPCTSSRTEAPLAQCVPRLIGLSQDGSWPTQTPFCTSAVTVQPTEQCVQMFFTRVTGCWWFIGPAAAGRTVVNGMAPRAESPTPVSPACLRKDRRSSPPEDSPA